MSSISLARTDDDTPRTALAAARSQVGVVAVFLAAAALAWWWTARRMVGMDAGPGTDLGALGWFTGVWVVMMAAMMLPSLAPAAAAHTRPERAQAARSGSSSAAGRLARSILFGAGYLLVWTAVGVTAYAIFALGRDLLASQLAWNAAGRWVAGGVLVLAAAYELTPLKAACLARCGSPHAFARATLRESWLEVLWRGTRNGVWCLGCSGALMAALFALGVMSLTWMALLAALVALEKLAPLSWRRPAVALTSALLLVLAIAVLATPHNIPSLVVPHGSMHSMHGMGGPLRPMHGP